MGILAGISTVVAIVFATLYFMDRQSSDEKMATIRELHKKLEESKKKLAEQSKAQQPGLKSIIDRSEEVVLLQKEIERLNTYIENKDRKIQAYEEKEKELQDSMNDKIKDKRISQLESENLLLKEQLRLKESPNGAAKSLKDSFQNQIYEKDSEISRLKKEIAELEEYAESREQEVKKLEDSNKKLQSAEKKLGEQAGMQQSPIEKRFTEQSVNPNPDILMKQKENLQKQLFEKDKEISAFKKNVSNLKKDLLYKDTVIRMLEDEKQSSTPKPVLRDPVKEAELKSLREHFQKREAELLEALKKEKERKEADNQEIQAETNRLKSELETIEMQIVEKQKELASWESQLDEKQKQLEQEYKKNGDAIISEARIKAKDIEESAMEKHISYQRYTEELARKGFKLRSGYDQWQFDWINDEDKKDRALLKDNIKRQREIIKMSFVNAVCWHSEGDTRKVSCDISCFKNYPFSSPKAKMAIMGVNYLERAMEEARPNFLKWGLQESLDYLMDMKANVESGMKMAWMQPEFDEDYIALKIEEITLRYNIELRKQHAREELKSKKDAEREEAKAQKEFERELKRAKKDEDEARKALEKAQLEAAKEEADKERLAKLQQQIEKLQTALKEAEERGQRIMSMAQQTRRGWVYIISNIGSFGDGVYKIGLTRRLDPMERVYELGDASVPFPFDVHAFIFSEDAPALETALHQAFDHCKLNSVNYRKEYFRVPLEKIKAKVKELGYDVEFEDYPYAPQFRDSVLRK